MSTGLTVDLADHTVDSADEALIRINNLRESSRGLCRPSKYKTH